MCILLYITYNHSFKMLAKWVDRVFTIVMGT